MSKPSWVLDMIKVGNGKTTFGDSALTGGCRKKCKKWTSNFHHFFKCRSSPPSLSLPQVRKGEAKCMVQCYKSPPLQSPSLSLPTITHQTFNLATPLWHSQVRSRRDNFHWIIETITLPSALYRGPPSRSLSLSFSLPPSFLSHSSISMERYAVNSCLSLSPVVIWPLPPSFVAVKQTEVIPISRL